jgi:hypothetical protein
MSQAIAAAAKDIRRLRRRTAATVLLAILGVVGYLFWRATSIHSLPEIPDPFDRIGDGIVLIPDDENAFTFYRRAYDAFSRAPGPRTTTGYEVEWSKVDARDLALLEGQREAMRFWLEGTKRDRAIQVQPAARDLDSGHGRDNDRLRKLAQLANLQAFKLQHEGDLVGAWSWVRANLRAGRHLGMHGEIMDRWYGGDITNTASFQLKVWADDPKVDLGLLRRALDDAVAIDAMTAPYRETIRTEYFLCMNLLDNPEMRERMIATDPRDGKDRSGGFKHRLGAWLAPLFHEPERSRRVIRLHVANWLSVCDLPPAERALRKVNFGKLILFRPAPGEPSPVSPSHIARWTETSRYFHDPSASNIFCRMMEKDEQVRGRPIVALVKAIYEREHGRPPESVEALLGPDLPALPPGYDPAKDSWKMSGPTR